MLKRSNMEFILSGNLSYFKIHISVSLECFDDFIEKNNVITYSIRKCMALDFKKCALSMGF